MFRYSDYWKLYKCLATVQSNKSQMIAYVAREGSLDSSLGYNNHWLRVVELWLQPWLKVGLLRSPNKRYLRKMLL